jgi:predicted ArsR family transcriptional regulator
MSASQIRCLASPLRSQLLPHLQGGHGHTAAELASRMGIPLKRIYHHLHELLAAGLIQIQETHRKRGQDEVVYGPVAHHYIIQPDPRDPEYLEAAADRVDATFRAASRENRRVLEAAREHPEVLELGIVLRLDVCVSKAAAQEFIQNLEQVLSALRDQHSPDNEQWLSVTAAVLPQVRVQENNLASDPITEQQ